jgi:MSHA biogenesis protein MshJ
MNLPTTTPTPRAAHAAGSGSALRQAWQRQAQRIDALSLRERVMMFASVAVVAVALADALLLSPLLARQRGLALELQTQARALAALRSQLDAADAAERGEATPAGRLLTALHAVQAEREALQAELAPLSTPSRPAPQLEELLERALQRHAQLTLLHLAVTAPPAAIAAAGGPQLQGVTLTLAGPYAALDAFLAETEAALPGLRWGPVHLTGGGTAGPDAATAHGSSPRLQLQLFLPAQGA